MEAEKLRFIALSLTGGAPMTQLCASFGISRQAGYELLARYRAEGLDCARSRSRAPHVQPRATPAMLVDLIVALRLERPTWGPKKLRARLAMDDPKLDWPSVSVIGDILKREGLVSDRRRRRSALPLTRPFAQVKQANDTWCIDFKGWFKTMDGQRCDPFTVSDAYSRFLLACRIVEPTHAGVAPVMEQLMRDHGLPKAIRSDNGPPFASIGAAGLTRLSAHWLKLGVVLERIDPGSPQQNGRHERMHGTLKKEATQPPSADPPSQQIRLDKFRTDFNAVRPHEALGQTVPADHYKASSRPYPDVVPEPTYDADHAVRRVRGNGTIKWGGELIFVAEALIDEPVGVAQTETGEFIVRFCGMDLGLIDRAGKTMRRFTSPRPGRGEAAKEQKQETVTHVTGP
jgi:transposase InsO family protein